MDNNEGKKFSKTHLKLKYWGQVSVFGVSVKCYKHGWMLQNRILLKSLHLLMYY